MHLQDACTSEHCVTQRPESAKDGHHEEIKATLHLHIYVKAHIQERKFLCESTCSRRWSRRDRGCNAARPRSVTALHPLRLSVRRDPMLARACKPWSVRQVPFCKLRLVRALIPCQAMKPWPAQCCTYQLCLVIVGVMSSSMLGRTCCFAAYLCHTECQSHGSNHQGSSRLKSGRLMGRK